MNNNLKRRNYNDNIYEYSRHLKVIKDDRVRNSSGRLFQYFGAATIKASYAYIDETSGKESFISSHLRIVRVVDRIMSPNKRRTVYNFIYEFSLDEIT